MKKKHLWLLLLALLLALLWWRYRDSAEVEQREDPSLIFDRLWVDSAPQKDTDYINAVVLLRRLPVGGFQRASSYRLLAERFDYRRKGNRLSLGFPQSGKEHRLTFKIRECDELPPYDLCLDLSKNPWENGPTRFYGAREQRRTSERHRRLRRRIFSGLE